MYYMWCIVYIWCIICSVLIVCIEMRELWGWVEDFVQLAIVHPPAPTVSII